MMSEIREYSVRIPKAWLGPRKLKIQGRGLSIYLSLDEANPHLQSKTLVLTDEQVEMLRQNGLSVRVVGKKPKTETPE